MNLRQLEILHSVVSTGSTVAAARHLNMSQPAVSNAIKSAELSLGFMLFDRVNKRLIPTEEARLLLDEAEPLFRLKDVVKQTAQQLRDGRRGRINIVSTAELSASLLPQAVTSFLNERPDVYVSVDTQRLDRVLDHVGTGIADIGFAIEPLPRPALDYHSLSNLDIVCLCPTGSPLCEHAFVTPAHLKETSLINAGTSSRLHNMVQEVFRRSKVAYSPTLDVRFMNIAGLFVKENIGVTFMDELTASSLYFQGVESVPFRPRLKVNISAIVAADRPMPRLVRAMIQHAQTEIHQRLEISQSRPSSQPAPHLLTV